MAGVLCSMVGVSPAAGNTYTVPTAAFTDDSNTRILLHFNGAYTDDNSSGRTAKTMSTLDSPTRSSSIKVFGSEALNLPYQTASAPRVITTTSHSDFQWYSQNTTIEGWFRTSTFSDHEYAYGSGVPKGLGSTSGSDWGWSLGFTEAGKIKFFYFAGGYQDLVSTTTLSINTYYHVFFDHRLSDGRIRLGVNGNIETIGTKVGSPVVGNTFTIGNVRISASEFSPPYFFDEVRVSHTLRY